jgi:hypothetical protein
MGFFGLLRSIEDFLYEVMTWLVFYPRTLWQVICHPESMIEYSDREQGDAAGDQYTDTLSPPLFLILTILIAHGLELSFAPSAETPSGPLGKLVSGSEETMLMLRAILFSIFPLTYAVALLQHSEQALDRKTLRAPFFSQCYLGALFALVMSIATIILRHKSVELQVGGLVMIGVSVAGYIGFQAGWFTAHLPIGKWSAIALSIGTFIKATLINGLFSAMFLV